MLMQAGFLFLMTALPVYADTPDATELQPEHQAWKQKLQSPDVAIRLSVIPEVENYFRQMPFADDYVYKQVIPLVLPILQDADGSIRAQGAALLKEVSGNFNAPRMVRAMSKLLADPDPTTRYLAVEILGECNSPVSVRTLLDMLREDKDAYVRGGAAMSLGNLQAHDAVEPLLNILQDTTIYRYTRIFAAEALGKIGDKQALPALLKALQDKEDLVKLAAVQVLGRFKDPATLEPLKSMLTYPNAEIRAAAASSLGQTVARTALPNLKESLRDPDPEVRNAAANAITRASVPKMAITMEGPRIIWAHRTITYTIQVTNLEDKPLADVRVEIPRVSPAMAYAGSDPRARWSPQSRDIVWTFPEFPARATRTLTVALLNVARGPYMRHCAKVLWGELRLECAEACADLQAQCWGLAAHINTYDTDDPVEVGKATVYVVDIRNEGTSDVTNLLLVDTIPKEMEFITATGPTTFKREGWTISFAPVAVLPPGEKVTYRFSCKAIAPGSAKNMAEITYDQFERSIIDEEGTSVYK